MVQEDKILGREAVLTVLTWPGAAPRLFGTSQRRRRAFVIGNEATWCDRGNRVGGRAERKGNGVVFWNRWETEVNAERVCSLCCPREGDNHFGNHVYPGLGIIRIESNGRAGTLNVLKYSKQLRFDFRYVKV
ncbi:DIMBOA UDP-glucosyltransferase BX9 [Frankliniella fusca]|uniref:DIMBOA UDP-glucosyltransferase BX9 n=1 Tax=Frankliniella fusca TaxID=407009 RepID=A0AAE1HCL6_9NEOP|nr:DIMBOA UDP-glucosyltransferase BX9 [Frankliniella fusca]